MPATGGRTVSRPLDEILQRRMTSRLRAAAAAKWRAPFRRAAPTDSWFRKRSSLLPSEPDLLLADAPDFFCFFVLGGPRYFFSFFGFQAAMLHLGLSTSRTRPDPVSTLRSRRSVAGTGPNFSPGSELLPASSRDGHRARRSRTLAPPMKCPFLVFVFRPRRQALPAFLSPRELAAVARCDAFRLRALSNRRPRCALVGAASSNSGPTPGMLTPGRLRRRRGG